MTPIETVANQRSRRNDDTARAEITADGYLRLPGAFAQQYFPADRCAGLVTGGRYVLMPASVHAPNGMIIKQRNLAGDRSVLVREVWGDDHPVGPVTVIWQAARRRLVLEGAATSTDTTLAATTATATTATTATAAARAASTSSHGELL